MSADWQLCAKLCHAHATHQLCRLVFFSLSNLPNSAPTPLLHSTVMGTQGQRNPQLLPLSLPLNFVPWAVPTDPVSGSALRPRVPPACPHGHCPKDCCCSSAGAAHAAAGPWDTWGAVGQGWMGNTPHARCNAASAS